MYEYKISGGRSIFLKLVGDSDELCLTHKGGYAHCDEKKLYISLDTMVNLLDIRMEVSEALLDDIERETSTPLFSRMLLGGLLVKLVRHEFNCLTKIGFTQHVEICGKLIPKDGGIELFGCEWLFLIVACKNLYQIIPNIVAEIRHCHANHKTL